MVLAQPAHPSGQAPSIVTHVQQCRKPFQSRRVQAVRSPGRTRPLLKAPLFWARALAWARRWYPPWGRQPLQQSHLQRDEAHLLAVLPRPLYLRLLRTWRAVGRGIFHLFHLTIVLASLLVHVWMAARSVTVTGTTSRPLPTSSSTCRTGGTLSRIPRAGVLYWDDIDNGTLSIEFFDAMVESGGEPAPSWTLGVDGHGTVLSFSWLRWPLDEIKSRRDGPRTGNRHFILKKVSYFLFYYRSHIILCPCARVYLSI